MNSNPFQKLLSVLLIFFLGASLGYFTGTNKISFEWKNYRPLLNIENKNPPKGVNVDLSLFWDVWERLTKNYVDKKAFDPQKMLYGAISGMVESLGDPYTVFLPPEQNKEIKQELSGQFEGIGAQLGIKDKKIVVIAPLPDSPAQKAGIKAGDIVVKVNDADVINWTLPETVAKIRGARGTTVKLTIFHEGGDKPVEVSIVRETIHVKSVEGWVKEACEGCSRVAYIKLTQFGEETNNEWLITVNNIVSLINQGQPNTKGLVLDVRNNSGGFLNGAIFIASEFIKEGTIVIQEKGDGQKQKFTVTRRGMFTELPVAVLINKGSASASEIVAAALHDNRKAKLVGENSFGKGTIQEAQELGGGAGLHITVAKWLTPSGNWVNGKGLAPDIMVVRDEKDSTHDAQLERAIEELIK